MILSLPNEILQIKVSRTLMFSSGHYLRKPVHQDVHTPYSISNWGLILALTPTPFWNFFYLDGSHGSPQQNWMNDLFGFRHIQESNYSRNQK